MLARFVVALLAAIAVLVFIVLLQVYHLEQAIVTNRMLLEDTM